MLKLETLLEYFIIQTWQAYIPHFASKKLSLSFAVEERQVTIHTHEKPLFFHFKIRRSWLENYPKLTKRKRTKTSFKFMKTLFFFLEREVIEISSFWYKNNRCSSNRSHTTALQTLSKLEPSCSILRVSLSLKSAVLMRIVPSQRCTWST